MSIDHVAQTQATRINRLPLLALLSANAISLSGNMLTQVALPWFVLETTGSAAQTGLTAFAGTLPLVIGAFFGGALVDRIGHKRASIIADVISGMMVALIPLLYHTVGLAFWQLLILVFLGALLDIPGATAHKALAPELAALAGLRLEKANAAFATIERGSLLIGPILAGVLIASVGASNVLWIDALSFGVSAGLVGLIPAMRSTKTPVTSSDRYFADLIAGLRFILRSRLLRTVAFTATISNFFLSPVFNVMLPVYINTTYGDAARLGLLIAAFGAGAVLSAILYGVIGHRLPRRALFVGGFAVFGLVMLGIALLPPFAVLFGLMALMGLASGPLNPMIWTVLQERTPQEFRARVFGTVMALAIATTPLGMLIAGYLLEIWGAQISLLLSAACSVVLAASLFVNPALSELNALPHADADSQAALRDTA
ncbi:MAG: MFS transporter [Chloroflexales bacterium]|nr:MFS transporter [Chloroflexales bacterium]